MHNDDFPWLRSLEIQENKNAQRAEIEAQMREFERRGGKITPLPDAMQTYDRQIKVPTEGCTDSGYPGIVWSTEKNQWSVRTPNSRRHIGYSDTIAGALKMQEERSNKQQWKEGKVK